MENSTEENSTNQEDYDEFLPEIYRSDDYLAAGLILVIASIGLIVHAKNLFDYRQDTQPMTYLIRARIVTDLLVLLIFLTYVMPVALFALDNVKAGYWNRISDWISSWAYMYIVFLEPLVATNRFIAIFLPFSYGRIFTKGTTLASLSIALATSMGTIMFDLIGEDCVYSFDYAWLSWGFPDSPCGHASEMFGFLVPAYFCSGMTFALNLIICIRLLMFEFYKKPNRAAEEKRSNIHIRFFIQSCIQFAVFLVDLIVNTCFEEPDGRLMTFVYYSLIWMTLHTVDGLIIHFFRPKAIKESASTVVTIKTKSLSSQTS